MKRSIAAVLLLMISLISARAIAASLPQELVKDTSQRMIEALNKNRETLKQNPGKIYDLVNQIVLPNFDFELMSRWVLGRYWRDATPEQRSEFTNEFRTLLVRSYASALLEYSNEEIRYLPMPPGDGKDDVTVRTEFVPKNGSPIPINYTLHSKDGAWKVYDVTVDGVSLVTNYRGTFVSQIRQGGMEAVINDLKERNRRQATR